MRSLKHFFEQSWLLIVASFCFGLVIAATHAALSPRIELNKITKLTNLARRLVPETKRFVPVEEDIETRSLQGKAERVGVYKMMDGDRLVGWTFKVVGSGFADKIELVVAVDGRFETLAGFDVLASNETVGFGDQIKHDDFRGQFEGVPATALSLSTTGNPDDIDSTIVAISGATVTSTAVVEAINHYLVPVKEELQQKGLIGDGN